MVNLSNLARTLPKYLEAAIPYCNDMVSKYTYLDPISYHFYENCVPMNFEPTDLSEVVINEISYSTSEAIELFENKKIRYAKLARPTNIRGIHFSAHHHISYYENGEIESGTLARSRRFKTTAFGERLFNKDYIFFAEDGYVDSGVLGEQVNYEREGFKLTIPKGASISISGKLLLSFFTDGEEKGTLEYKGRTYKCSSLEMNTETELPRACTINGEYVSLD